MFEISQCSKLQNIVSIFKDTFALEQRTCWMCAQNYVTTKQQKIILTRHWYKKNNLRHSSCCCICDSFTKRYQFIITLNKTCTKMRIFSTILSARSCHCGSESVSMQARAAVQWVQLKGMSLSHFLSEVKTNIFRKIIHLCAINAAIHYKLLSNIKFKKMEFYRVHIASISAAISAIHRVAYTNNMSK